MQRENTITFTNPTSHTIRLESIGLEDVAPGADIEVPLHLCAPTRADNGNRKHSPIETVAPQLRPKNDEDHKLWLKTPDPVKPQSKIVTVTARPASEAPGVAALRAQVEAAKAKAIADALKRAADDSEEK